MEFFSSAIDTLRILVIALGAGLGAWGIINLTCCANLFWCVCKLRKGENSLSAFS